MSASQASAGCTAKEQGLVHAMEGPLLVEGKYTVTLAPIGRQGKHEKISSKEDVHCMAHGLLHGLAAIHRVSELVGHFQVRRALQCKLGTRCKCLQALFIPGQQLT